MHLQGSSADFIVGRIFDKAARDAFDDIVKIENGLPLEMSKWIMDDKLERTKAKVSYLKSNCVLIK